MHTALLLNSGIENIDTIYEGMRGTTLSSRHNMRHWTTVVESGIKTIIELRKEDHSNRLCQMCVKHGIRYFEFPIDSYNVADENIAPKLPNLFSAIDEGAFYIACAMGLHRTDLALSIYWIFHGANKGLPPPFLKGHIENDTIVINRVHNKIFRRLNSLYNYLSTHNIIPIPDVNTFKKRKELLLNQEKMFKRIKTTYSYEN